MDKSIIANHLYNDTYKQAKDFISGLTDDTVLFTYTYNYNWDNGFEIPTAIMSNKHCSLSTALLLFHLGDGISYLTDRSSISELPEWGKFIENLYHKILNNDFPQNDICFKPQVSKVQEYKLKKILSEEELIFITPIEGSDYYISL